ncbi:MAG: ketoacyl-ACP synthase III [Limnochordales bacterium]|nr:beta-ketoacyl-ACP synthase III [Limnochordales bacterium]
MRSAGILGVGFAVPERRLTNADLEKMVDTSDEWITTRTGIKERRIADDDTAASDLAVAAAQRALQQAQVDPADIDLVIVATVTGDYVFPSTACLVQDRLGIPRAAAYDLAAGCSGFVYGLDQAWHGVRTGAYRHALVIGSEILSRVTDWTDRSTCVLFGDGAGAVVVGPTAPGFGLLATYLGSDGSGADKLYIPAGGSRRPLTAEALAQREQYVRMCGNDVFKFAVRVIEEASLEVLRRAGLTPSDVNLFIPHQANIRIIDAAARRLGLDWERIVVNVDRYGNTSAASIPIALGEALEAGRIRPGDYIVTVGFGAGLTWGAAAMRWSGRDGAP